MKRIFFNLIFIFTFAVTVNAYAICDLAQVKALDQAWLNAMASLDTNNVMKLYANNAVLVPNPTSSPIVNHEELSQYFSGFLAKFQHLNIKKDSNSIQLLSSNAISTGTYTLETTMHDGQNQAISTRYMFVYESTPADCILINQKFSNMPSN